MEKLRNNDGSTLLMTIGLIALFSVLLGGFYTAIVAMTARVDSTYSEKQTYLYSRSAVTALAQELIQLNTEYDTEWEQYCDAMDAWLEDPEGSDEPTKPEKHPLLAAVDDLATDATLTMSDCSFGEPLVDDYVLDMEVTKLMVAGAGDVDVPAFELSATTTIDGVRKVSDTVSILLSTQGKEFEVGQVGTGSGSTGGSSFSGIYTDKPIVYPWDTVYFEKFAGGSEIVCNESMNPVVQNGFFGGEPNANIKVNGNLIFNVRTTCTLENINFYVNGDFILENMKTDTKLINCNFYVTGKFMVKAAHGSALLEVKDCDINANNGVDISSGSGRTHFENHTIDENANLTYDDLKIPERPEPNWVKNVDKDAAQDYGYKDGVMEAGKTYKLVNTLPTYESFQETYNYLEDSVLPTDATAENPVTIIVPSDVKVCINSDGNPNVRFLVEPGARIKVNPNKTYKKFESDIYSYSESDPNEENSNDAVIDLWSLDSYTGTIIAPTVKISTNKIDFGGDIGTTVVPEITTETISYDLYTDYIYIRG